LQPSFALQSAYHEDEKSQSLHPHQSVLGANEDKPLPSFSRQLFNSEQSNSSNTDKMNLLIVDDSNLNRKMLCKLFRTLGHVIDEAEDGLLAIEKVKAIMSPSEQENKLFYDIILIDFVMPNMNGPSATRVIRALGYTAPIFGLTGNALDSDIKCFLENGADRVMAKPFNMGLFKEYLSEIKCRESKNVRYSQ
jgi:CheY-like chemotaxis protein